jgi:hypothetical protein
MWAETTFALEKMWDLMIFLKSRHNQVGNPAKMESGPDEENP